MNIEEILPETLEVAEEPGLSVLDPRFGEIASLAQEGNYSEAAEQSKSIIGAKIYDIRIINYFLYGVFSDQGVGALNDIFSTLSRVMRDNWEAIGPLKNKEKQTKASLTWMLNQLNKKVEYEEGKKETIWKQWISEVESDQVQEALDAGDELKRMLGPILEDQAGPILEGLQKLLGWLKAFQQIVYREPEPEGEEAPEAEGSEDAVPSSIGSVGGAISTDGSYQLQILLKKIQAFEQLISKNEFPRAALIGNDINNIINNFDPRIYFPKLFARFSLLFAINIGELTKSQEYQGTVEWKAMEELYKVDIDGFVTFNADAIDLSAATPLPTGSGGNEQKIEQESALPSEESSNQDSQLDEQNNPYGHDDDD